MIGRAIPFILFAALVAAVWLAVGWLAAVVLLFVGPLAWLLWQGYNAPTAYESDRDGFVIIETAQERRAKRRGAIAPGARAVVK